MPDTDMDDAQRDLERNALRNVRALVDKLQREELGSAKRKRVVISLACIPFVAMAAALALHASKGPAEEADKNRRACELDGWNRRAAAFEKEDRAAHPGRSNKQVQDDLREAQPGLMAEAKAQCK